MNSSLLLIKEIMQDKNKVFSPPPTSQPEPSSF